MALLLAKRKLEGGTTVPLQISPTYNGPSHSLSSQRGLELQAIDQALAALTPPTPVAVKEHGQ